MTLTQVGSNARHHGIIEFADTDRERQHQQQLVVGDSGVVIAVEVIDIPR